MNEERARDKENFLNKRNGRKYKKELPREEGKAAESDLYLSSCATGIRDKNSECSIVFYEAVYSNDSTAAHCETRCIGTLL